MNDQDLSAPSDNRLVEPIFRRPLAGPLVLGRGRFTGFGLVIPIAG